MIIDMQFSSFSIVRLFLFPSVLSTMTFLLGEGAEASPSIANTLWRV